ncbi:hypothetical protein ACFW4K_08410 [Nocardiopsis alba]
MFRSFRLGSSRPVPAVGAVPDPLGEVVGVVRRIERLDTARMLPPGLEGP